MSTVPGHFLDRTLPVLKAGETLPARQRNGSIGFAKVLGLPARRLREVDHHGTETGRDVAGIQEVEHEIAVMFVDQALELFLHRLALSRGGNVVAQRDDEDLPRPFALQRGRRGLEVRHADFREKVHDPTDHDQFPDVENNADAGDGEHRRHNEGFQWKSLGNAEQYGPDRRQHQQEQERKLPHAPARRRATATTIIFHTSCHHHGLYRRDP